MIEAASTHINIRTGELSDEGTPDPVPVTMRVGAPVINNQYPAPAAPSGVALPATHEGIRARLDEIRAGAEADPRHPLNNVEHPDYARVEAEWLALHAAAASGVALTTEAATPDGPALTFDETGQRPAPAAPIELERPAPPPGYTLDDPTLTAAHGLGEQFGLGAEVVGLAHTLAEVLRDAPPDEEARDAELRRVWTGSAFDDNWDKIEALARYVQHLAGADPAGRKILQAMIQLERYPAGARELARFADTLHAKGDPDELERLLLALATQGARA